MFTFSHSAGDVSGGASEIKLEENIPMAECMACEGSHSASQSCPGGVIEGQQRMEGENDAFEAVEAT